MEKRRRSRSVSIEKVKKKPRSDSSSRSREWSKSKHGRKKSSESGGHSKEKRKARRRSSSSSSTTSSSSSSSSSSSQERRRKKKKKERRKKKKKHKKKLKKKKEKEEKNIGPVPESVAGGSPVKNKPEILSAAAARRPMTKEEWEKQQSVIKHVYDPETGRTSKQHKEMDCSMQKGLVYRTGDLHTILQCSKNSDDSGYYFSDILYLSKDYVIDEDDETEFYGSDSRVSLNPLT